jgi:hypothetical protein
VLEVDIRSRRESLGTIADVSVTRAENVTQGIERSQPIAAQGHTTTIEYNIKDIMLYKAIFYRSPYSGGGRELLGGGSPFLASSPLSSPRRGGALSNDPPPVHLS